MKHFLLSVSLLLIVGSASAQVKVQWQRSYGGSGTDESLAILQTPDSGYLVAGKTSSNNVDVSGNHGNMDYWLLKLNSTGAIQWQKCYGGSGSDQVRRMFATADGGYVIDGISNSIDGDVVNGDLKTVFWTIRIDATGTILWQKTGLGALTGLINLPQGGYFISGACSTNYLVARVDDTLGIIWQRCYGGSKTDETQDIQRTLDGGYIVVGNTNSSDGDIKDYQGVKGSTVVAWVLKLDSAGAIQWNKSFKDGNATRVRQLKDSTFLIAGSTTSNSAATGVRLDGPNYWVMKLKSNGDTLWQRAYGSLGGHEFLNSMQLTPDEGCVLAGYTSGFGGDVPPKIGVFDMYVVKLDKNGNLDWQKRLGGKYLEEGRDIQLTYDGGYIVAGTSSSNDGDVSRNYGGTDIWIVKLANDVGVKPVRLSEQCLVYPNPANNLITIQVTAELMNKEGGIYDLSGRSVKSFRITERNTSVPVNELAPGSYVVKIDGLYYDRVILKM